MKTTSFKILTQRFALVQAVVFLGLILCTSCKDDALLGIELQPEGQFDSLDITDDLSVSAFTLLGEPQRTDEAQSFIGKIRTPEFGTSESALILNFGFLSGNTQVDFTDYTVDSVVLHLRPNKIYGVPTDEIPIQVFQVTEFLDASDDYFSDFVPQTEPVAVGSATFSNSRQIKVTDTISINGSNEAFQFLVHLDASVGAYLKDGLVAEAYSNTSELQSYFNGLMLKVDSTMMDQSALGGIYSMALLTGESGIRLYVSNTADPTETEIIGFPITSQCARINQFTHDYAGSAAGASLNDPSSPEIYVQGLAGLRTEIQIPTLQTFAEQNNVAVAKATLQFKLSDNQSDLIGTSKRLYLLDLEEDGSESLTADYIYSSGRHGGFYDEEINGYTFDVTRHVQNVIQEAQKGNDVNFGLRLHAQVPVLNGNDTAHNVLQGLDNIALKLYHTDLTN